MRTVNFGHCRSRKVSQTKVLVVNVSGKKHLSVEEVSWSSWCRVPSDSQEGGVQNNIRKTGYRLNDWVLGHTFEEDKKKEIGEYVSFVMVVQVMNL